ncbi:hypothetical protein IFM89_038497 [Coptis chinensis]|uniref:Probable magnesium transporter n=1 Tax=Coptis chinensis TaxID=261450 RepID=A0A835MBN4_9MAGN|nr:hypothetical protein IFM89_038497 [Coptis chinensis]
MQTEEFNFARKAGTSGGQFVASVLVLTLHCAPRYGHTNIMVYIGICSIFESFTVMSVKAIGIAIKLTLEGVSQSLGTRHAICRLTCYDSYNQAYMKFYIRHSDGSPISSKVERQKSDSMRSSFHRKKSNRPLAKGVNLLPAKGYNIEEYDIRVIMGLDPRCEYSYFVTD